MQKRGFMVLAGLTLVLTVWAIWSVSGKDPAVGRAIPGQRAVPALGPKLSDLAWIRLSHGPTKANFAQIGGRWSVVEKGNYPAAAGKVKQMLLALADLRLVEAKTERPELFARLALDDPSNGKSTQVTLQDRTGATVAELIVGKRRYDRLGGGNDAVYVRRPGEDRAWLAGGSLDLAGDVISWLDRRIVDIPDKRIASVKFTGEDGATLTLSRTAPEEDFTVVDAPPDTHFKAPPLIAELAAALENFDLEDVKPAAELPVPDRGVATASFTTFDGLTVEVFVFERDNANWAAFDASGSGASEAEGKAITARAARWTYAIPAGKAKRLRTKLSDLIDAPKGS